MSTGTSLAFIIINLKNLNLFYEQAVCFAIQTKLPAIRIFPGLVQLQFHIYLILSIVMDCLLFDNSKNQMCFKATGQILLLRIVLHGNSYKRCYKMWIFLAAFWRQALSITWHQVTWRLFSIYGSGAITFKCKSDTRKTTRDMKTYWDVIVIT